MADEDLGDIKSQRKALKDAKKAEKLAKLQQKQQSAVQAQPKAKAKPKPASEGYDPNDVEAFWTRRWKELEWFKPKPAEKVFSICIPPPNITGSLHIGHAMMISIEDAIVRYKRLTGHEVLYLPGLDHAGIATQTVVLKSSGPLSRPEFMEAAHRWSEKYGSRIYEQFDRMGCSVDYSRKVFTLEPRLSRSVSSAFVQLFNKGLVYRDNKIVNWCGRLRTTLSDLEVDYKDVQGGSYIEVDGGSYRFGMMYYVKYHLTRNNPSDTTTPFVVIGTTRPETIIGDTAICVNPYDARFANIDEIFATGVVPDVLNEKHSAETTSDKTTQKTQADATEGVRINEEMKAEKKNKYKVLDKKGEQGDCVACTGLFAINPLTGKQIPVIFDTQADLAFGTGILKVTPCHDPIDFQLGKRHGLEFVKMLDENNCILEGLAFGGMKRFEARKAIVQHLTERGSFVKAVPHDQILPFCSRSGDLVEPMVKAQWWLNCTGMAQKAMDGVNSGDIKICPEEAKPVWNRWLENIRDWCLSRQLWWGHRIPAYRAIHKTDIVSSVGNMTISGSSERWIVAETEEEALAVAKAEGYDAVVQDEDVLDTWFSSGLWPFSTMGWPNKTADFSRYFPNSMLETGSDILFFWVARMVMLSYELCGTKPFDTILLHGIVRDSHGRKMSKSLGNVIDPLYVIDGIGIESMIESLNAGNLDRREVKRAADAIRKDYPQGIPKCGADALRFALLSYTNGMKDINLDILRVQGYSRLCNKLYNAYKYISGFQQAARSINGGERESNPVGACDEKKPGFAQTLGCLKDSLLLDHQKWILSRLNSTIAEQHKFMEAYNFMMATQSVHSLFYDFCDYFIELSKSNHPLDLETLLYVFGSILKIFNPFMPFVTEELHFKLFGEMIDSYPLHLEGDFETGFDSVLNMAKLCRSKKVKVERFEGIEYLTALTKNSFEEVDRLEDYDVMDGIKYSACE